jgi:agmatine deiminase
MKTQNLSNKNQEVPAKLGYSMPAEWAKHEATWLSWPHNVETWPGKRLAIVRDTYLQMLEGILPGEKVHLLVNDQKEKDEVLNFLKPKLDLKNLIFHEKVTVDTWIRDYGPTFLKNKQGKKAWCKWIFNAWGSKYPSLMEDTHVFQDTQLISHPCFPLDIVLEGGSIEVNGDGTCLTTEQCLLNKNRNPHLSRKEIETHLRNYLGVSHIVWLKEGIVGDDTDGHIDDIVRFVNPTTLVSAYEEDDSDENFSILKENWEDLEKSHDQNGKKWNLVKLPMPGKVVDDGVRLPASYANFLITNKSILLPVYRHRNDERAAKILGELFPDREILSISCNAMVYGLGAIHCVSQQEPA